MRVALVTLLFLAACAEVPPPEPDPSAEIMRDFRSISSSDTVDVRDVVQRPKIQVLNRSLGDLLAFAAGNEGKAIVIAGDVCRSATPICAEDGQTVAFEGYLERLAAENGLHVTHAGSVSVITRAPAEGDVASVGSATGDEVECAWSAPARGWFELLERATGRHVEHGNAPIDLAVTGAPLADLQNATAVASRVGSGAKALRDLPGLEVLPSGREIAVSLQAVLETRDLSLALINDRVLAEGDELIPGLRVLHIMKNYVVFLDRDRRFNLDPP